MDGKLRYMPCRDRDFETGLGPYTLLDGTIELQQDWEVFNTVYLIVAIKLLLTIAVAILAFSNEPLVEFIIGSNAGIALYVVAFFTSFIVLCVLYCCRKQLLIGYLLLGAFNVTLAFLVGLTCALISYKNSQWKVILECIILTSLAVASITLYTTRAVKRAQDFGFLSNILIGAIFFLLMFNLIQILFPFGRLSIVIHSCLAAIIFYGLIVCDMKNLVKQSSSDGSIWAMAAIYLDIVGLFVWLLSILRV